MIEVLNKISENLKTKIVVRGSTAFDITVNKTDGSNGDLDLLVENEKDFQNLFKHFKSLFKNVENGEYIYKNDNLTRKRLILKDSNRTINLDVLIAEDYFLSLERISKFGNNVFIPSKCDIISSAILSLCNNEIGIDFSSKEMKEIRFYNRIILLSNFIEVEILKNSLNKQLKSQNKFYSKQYTFEDIIFSFYNKFFKLKNRFSKTDSQVIKNTMIQLCSNHLGIENYEEINFYSSKESFGCFSNFSEYPVIFDNESWLTAEHCYQAQKFTDRIKRNEIKNQPTPKLAALVGRKDPNLLRSDWDFVKKIKMYNIIKCKVLQNPIVYITLLGTKEKPIKECSPTDEFWGIGSNKIGKNILGKIFMSIRMEIF